MAYRDAHKRDSRARIHDSESTGGQISGEVSNGASLQDRGTQTTWSAARWIGGAAAAAAILVVAIGLSAPLPVIPMHAGDAMPRALTDREPLPPPRPTVLVEELPVEPEPAPPTIPEPPPAAEPPTVAKPTRSRHHGSPATHRPARPTTSRRPLP